MKRQYLKIASTILAIFFVMVSKPCAAQQAETITVVHARGQAVVAKNPQRVVVFDFGSLETYHELGLEVVGVANNVPSYLPRYQDSTKYVRAGSLRGPDLAIVKGLKPDLIIISGRQGAQYDSLAAIAPTLFVGTDVNDYWNSFEKNVRTIASLHGKESIAEEKLTALRKKAELVREKSKNDPALALTVLHVNNNFAPNGPKSRFGFAYDVLGLKPAYTDTTTRTDRGNASEGGRSNPQGRPDQQQGRPNPQEGRPERPQGPSLSQINPDYLFIIDRATGIQGTMPELNDLLNDDLKATKAYKNGKVFLLPGNIWYLSGGGLISVEKQITDIGEQLYGIAFN